MNQYIESLNNELKEYFNILCDNNYPYFIDKYIELPELQRLKGIGYFCGCDYTKIYSIKYWYSRLDHSITCALMAWHFTKDKTQTLAALFHDIGTPAFSHCIDYLLNDTINQESSEKDVFDIIKSSNSIIKYLEFDCVELVDLKDTSKYTILENKKPKLCIDRLDGILHTCLIWLHCWEISKVKKVYNDIVVHKNEFGEDEIGFLDQDICEMFFDGIYEYSMALQKNEDKFVMQCISDLLKKLIELEKITIEDLYLKSELDIIDIINKYYSKEWNIFSNANELKRSNTKPNGVYSISVECKKRYVIPLCKNNEEVERLNDIFENCQKLLDEYLNFEDTKYSYIEGINM